MSVRPSLVRSVPFWILLVGSVATALVGVWLLVDKLAVMSVALTAQTATPADVYIGQVWAIVGGILIAAGIVGVALALVTAVIRSFVPATEVAFVEGLDWADDDTDDDEPTAIAQAEAATSEHNDPAAVPAEVSDEKVPVTDAPQR